MGNLHSLLFSTVAALLEFPPRLLYHVCDGLHDIHMRTPQRLLNLYKFKTEITSGGKIKTTNKTYEIMSILTDYQRKTK